jgi:hypothetical protein
MTDSESSTPSAASAHTRAQSAHFINFSMDFNQSTLDKTNSTDLLTQLNTARNKGRLKDSAFDFNLGESKKHAELEENVENNVQAAVESLQEEQQSQSRIALQHLAKRILYSKYYNIVYIIVFLAQLILLIYGLVNYSKLSSLGQSNAAYVVLDILFTLFFIVEIAIRIAAEPTLTAYFTALPNRIDFTIAVLCSLAIILYIITPSTAVIASLLQLIRYSAQLIRAFCMIKHTYTRQETLHGLQKTPILFDSQNNSSNSAGSSNLASITNKKVREQYKNTVRNVKFSQESAENSRSSTPKSQDSSRRSVQFSETTISTSINANNGQDSAKLTEISQIEVENSQNSENAIEIDKEKDDLGASEPSELLSSAYHREVIESITHSQ